MSESIYAPPQADVEVAESQEQDYYVVSGKKFYLLSVLTLNLYYVYWFYRNWRSVKVREGSDIWPVPRCIFYIFFTHSLLADVDRSIESSNRKFDWNPSIVATIFIVAVITMNILDRLSFREIGSPTTDLLGVLLVLVTPLLLLKAQRAINFVCNDPEGETNSNFTLANWGGMILGGLIWMVALLGIYLIIAAPEWLVE